MDEFLAWVRDRVVPWSPVVSLVDSDSAVVGYVGRVPVRASLPDDGGLDAARAVAGDVQAVELTPEDAVEVVGGRLSQIGGHDVVVTGWPSERVAYVGRRGPEIVVGVVSPGEFPEVCGAFQSVVAFGGAGVGYPRE